MAENWYLVIAAAALTALLVWGYGRKIREESLLSRGWGYYAGGTAIFVVAAGLCIAGMRGGMTRMTRPITLSNATLYTCLLYTSVVYAAFIGRRIVFAQILVHGDLLRLLLLFGRMFLFLQHDVVLNLLFDTLFELHGGQLQELDHLNLLRRELLLKR